MRTRNARHRPSATIDASWDHRQKVVASFHPWQGCCASYGGRPPVGGRERVVTAAASSTRCNQRECKSPSRGRSTRRPRLACWAIWARQGSRRSRVRGSAGHASKSTAHGTCRAAFERPTRRRARRRVGPMIGKNSGIRSMGDSTHRSAMTTATRAATRYSGIPSQPTGSRCARGKDCFAKSFAAPGGSRRARTTMRPHVRDEHGASDEDQLKHRVSCLTSTVGVRIEHGRRTSPRRDDDHTPRGRPPARSRAARRPVESRPPARSRAARLIARLGAQKAMHASRRPRIGARGVWTRSSRGTTAREHTPRGPHPQRIS